MPGEQQNCKNNSHTATFAIGAVVVMGDTEVVTGAAADLDECFLDESQTSCVLVSFLQG